MKYFPCYVCRAWSRLTLADSSLQDREVIRHGLIYFKINWSKKHLCNPGTSTTTATSANASTDASFNYPFSCCCSNHHQMVECHREPGHYQQPASSMYSTSSGPFYSLRLCLYGSVRPGRHQCNANVMISPTSSVCYCLC